MKIILQFTLISTVIFLLFKYNVLVYSNLYGILIIFVKKIIPSMFPIIFLTNYIKYNILSRTNNKHLRYISLLFSFAPSNAIISCSYKELLYSSILNPLFSYSILINYFSIHKTIVIITINLLFNYVLLFKNLCNSNNYIENVSVTTIIKETTNSIINILGVIIFFNVLISLISIFISIKYLFFVEITNGFNIINSFNNNLLKEYTLIFLNSFGGIAIFMQIKSINNDANYKFLINKFLLSILITLITSMMLKCM